MKKKTLTDNFLEARISWRQFQDKMEADLDDLSSPWSCKDPTQMLLLEILKELQHSNNFRIRLDRQKEIV